jgi:hypothetical protein
MIGAMRLPHRAIDLARQELQRRLAVPESIEWTPPARPFFGEAALLWRPRTDPGPQQQRSVLDWYLEVG